MTSFSGSGFKIVADPLLPPATIAALALIGFGVIGFGLWHRARGSGWRGLTLLLGLMTLINPALIEETRQFAKDTALLVVDDSASQTLASRWQQTETALAALLAAGKKNPDLDLKIVALGPGLEGTPLIGQLEKALQTTPSQRFAGAILLTDGQVHDAPSDPAGFPGPVHILLTGAPEEGDRRLALLARPSFALIDRPTALTFRVEEPKGGEAVIPVTLRLDGTPLQTIEAPANQDVTLDITLRHGGTSVVELAIPPGPQELTLQNNQAVLTLQGIRDRLRVLLISGEPHPGERPWRNLLKTDPSVDLIHFTILRPTDQGMDPASNREISLIAFPARELFEVKLNEFDLIIFDRYQQKNSLIPLNYLQAVANYVKGGGAVLEIASPGFATSQGLFTSPIGSILPGQPTGHLFELPFRPQVTSLGRRHPVTRDLKGAGDPQIGEAPSWGRWFRSVEVIAHRGQIVMTGPNDRPLLILDRVGDGRVAQVLSDQLWLWSRGYDGGGPQMELLRRLAHWLMKEPTLEEEDLAVSLEGDHLQIARRSLQPISPPGGIVTVTAPDDTSHPVPLTEQNGTAVGRFALMGPGIYRLEDGGLRRIVAVDANSKEMNDVRATDKVLQPLAQATGGTLHWLKDGIPELRRTETGRPTRGYDWLGLPKRHDYTVSRFTRINLLPDWLMLLLVGGGLVMGWRREGV